MDNNEEKIPKRTRSICLILAIIAGICFWAVHPLVGMIVGFWAWMIYRHDLKEIAFKQRKRQEKAANPETKQLIETIIREQSGQEIKPYDYSTHIIQRGSLPDHIHNLLDEMEIVTWEQLSLCDEKELLYKKCFGEKTLENIKTELAQRGLTLNNSKDLKGGVS